MQICLNLFFVVSSFSPRRSKITCNFWSPFPRPQLPDLTRSTAPILLDWKPASTSPLTMPGSSAILLSTDWLESTLFAFLSNNVSQKHTSFSCCNVVNQCRHLYQQFSSSNVSINDVLSYNTYIDCRGQKSAIMLNKREKGLFPNFMDVVIWI